MSRPHVVPVEPEVSAALPRDLDVASCPAVASAVLENLPAHVRTLRLDASRVEHVDAAGVRVLRRLRQALAHRQVRLTIDAAGPPLALRLEAVGVPCATAVARLHTLVPLERPDGRCEATKAPVP